MGRRTVGLVGLLVIGLAAAIALGCGGGGDGASTPSARSTLEAAIEAAEGEEVSDATKEYARQLCDPYTRFIDALAGVPVLVDHTPRAGGSTATAVEDLSAAFELFDQLVEPVNRLARDLEDVEAPEELSDYHQAVLARTNYSAEAVERIAEGGLFAVIALGDSPPNPEEPQDLSNALLLECGEEIADYLEGADVLESVNETPTDTGEQP